MTPPGVLLKDQELADRGFKVSNEQSSGQGAMRLLDKAGAPLKDLKIKLSP